jgi:hypothetical protein
MRSSTIIFEQAHYKIFEPIKPAPRLQGRFSLSKAILPCLGALGVCFWLVVDRVTHFTLFATLELRLPIIKRGNEVHRPERRPEEGFYDHDQRVGP